MIKARAGNLYLIGLSSLNLERLQQGKPIKFALRELGIELDGDIVITWGPTEADIAREMGMPDEVVANAEKLQKR